VKRKKAGCLLAISTRREIHEAGSENRFNNFSLYRFPIYDMRKWFTCQEPKGVFQGVFLGSYPANRANLEEIPLKDVLLRIKKSLSWVKRSNFRTVSADRAEV